MFAVNRELLSINAHFYWAVSWELLHADKLLFAFNYGFLLEYFWTFTLIYNPNSLVLLLYVQPYETEITGNSIIPLRMKHCSYGDFCSRQNLDLISFDWSLFLKVIPRFLFCCCDILETMDVRYPKLISFFPSHYIIPVVGPLNKPFSNPAVSSVTPNSWNIIIQYAIFWIQWC